MANFLNRFPQARLWLVSLSAVGFALGAAPLGIAQDIPTPTPPADGGAFEGAPDPTPSPEVTPEPSTSPVEPSTSLPGTSSPQIESPVPTNGIPTGDVPTGDVPTNGIPTGDIPTNGIPTGDVPINDLPTGDVPTGDVVEPAAGSLGEEPNGDDIPSTEQLPGNVSQDQAAPVAEPGVSVDSPTTDAPVSPGAGSAPANNSPRGLW